MKNLTLLQKTFLHRNMFILFSLFFTYGSLFAQKPVKNKDVKDHYGAKNVIQHDGKSYNLSEFKSKQKSVIPENVKNMVDKAKHAHPEFGVSVHPKNPKAIELVDKREPDSRTYLEGNEIIITKYSKPVHYLDNNGWIRSVNNELSSTPLLNGVYRTEHHPVGKEINFQTGRTVFKANAGEMATNQFNKLKFLNESYTEINAINMQAGTRQIGNNGLFVENMFPMVDMQVILMDQGSVKTNYIVKDRNAINASSKYTAVEDVFTIPNGFTIEKADGYTLTDGLILGSLRIRDLQGEEYAFIEVPKIYDNTSAIAIVNSEHKQQMSLVSSEIDYRTISGTLPTIDANYYHGAYKIEQLSENTYKISVLVETSWLLDETRVYPVVIDPEIIISSGAVSGTNPSGASITTGSGGTNPVIAAQAMVGFANGVGLINFASVSANGCYRSSLTLPAGYMLINAPITVTASFTTYGPGTAAGCWYSDAGMKFFGPCGQYPRPTNPNFWYSCAPTMFSAFGECYGIDVPSLGTLSRCSTSDGEDCATPTTPSCADQTITVAACFQSRIGADNAANKWCGFGMVPGQWMPNSGASNTARPFGQGGTALVPNFSFEIRARSIESTLVGPAVINVCPNSVQTLTSTTIYGVPKNFNVNNCTALDMAGQYQYTVTATGGATVTTGSGLRAGTSTHTITMPAAAATVVVTVVVCNADCSNSPAGAGCVTRTFTFNVGDAVPPTVSSPINACNNNNVGISLGNTQAGYTYTFYTSAMAVLGTTTTAANNFTIAGAGIADQSRDYFVRATAPCNSVLVPFTVTWGAVQAPIGTEAGACAGGTATLSASCGGNCQWFAAAAGGVALTTGGSLVVAGPNLTVNNVPAGGTTYYVAYVSGACASARVPVNLTNEGLIVNIASDHVNPICPADVANLTASFIGGDFTSDNVRAGVIKYGTANANGFAIPNSASVAAGPHTFTARCDPFRDPTQSPCTLTTSGSGANTVVSGGTPCGCNTANSVAFTVTAPACVNNPLVAGDISRICFTTGTSTDFHLRYTDVVLQAPWGTEYTLLAGGKYNLLVSPNNTQICVDISAPGSITNTAIAPSGSYSAESNFFSDYAGKDPTGDWNIFFINRNSPKASQPTQFELGPSGRVRSADITFGCLQSPIVSWTAPVTGSLANNDQLINAWTTPAAGGASYNFDLEVTITDANGCQGVGLENVTCVIALPVTWLDFYGEVTSTRQHKLYWQTASEKNNDYFVLESRSDESLEYKELGKVKSVENSTSISNYEFINASPFNGNNYYRIKQVDKNGNFSYSKTILLANDLGIVDLLLIPNPATKLLTLKYFANFESESSIKIFDAKGSMIIEIDKLASKGVNIQEFDVSNFAKGVYSVVLNHNGNIITERFIKQ